MGGRGIAVAFVVSAVAIACNGLVGIEAADATATGAGGASASSAHASIASTSGLTPLATASSSSVSSSSSSAATSVGAAGSGGSSAASGGCTTCDGDPCAGNGGCEPTLFLPLANTNVTALATDGATLFFADGTNLYATDLAAPPSVVILAPTAVTSMVASAGHVVWSDGVNPGVHATTASSPIGPPLHLYPDTGGVALSVDLDGSVVSWSDGASAYQGSIDGSSSVTTIGSAFGCQILSWDGSGAFCTVDNVVYDPSGGGVYHAIGATYGWMLASRSSDAVFWFQSDNLSIGWNAKDGAVGETVIAHGHSGGAALDASGALYFTQQNNGCTASQAPEIDRFAPGDATPTAIAANLATCPGPIAVTSHAIYYGAPDGVWRVVLP